jgi:hypothetical protein
MQQPVYSKSQQQQMQYSNVRPQQSIQPKQIPNQLTYNNIKPNPQYKQNQIPQTYNNDIQQYGNVGVNNNNIDQMQTEDDTYDQGFSDNTDFTQYEQNENNEQDI